MSFIYIYIVTSQPEQNIYIFVSVLLQTLEHVYIFKAAPIFPLK